MLGIKKIQNQFKKIPIFIAKNAFYFFLFFSLTSVLITYTKIFRHFSIIEKKEITIQPPKIQINDSYYNQFIQNYSKRKEKASTFIDCPDIFFGQ